MIQPLLFLYGKAQESLNSKLTEWDVVRAKDYVVRSAYYENIYD